MAALLVLPLFSVSALAPFDEIVFAVVGLGALAVAARLPKKSVEIAPPWLAVPGGRLFLLGWVYPHLLEDSSRFAYLHASPAGRRCTFSGGAFAAEGALQTGGRRHIFGGLS